MRTLAIGLAGVAVLALTAGTVLLAARAQQRPGDIAQAHVWVDNRRPDESIPVVVQRNLDPLRVQVMTPHTVVIDPMNVVNTRAARQQWEYRTLTLGTDRAAALAAAGLDGWEAVGFQTGAGTGEVLLKRPR